MLIPRYIPVATIQHVDGQFAFQVRQSEVSDTPFTFELNQGWFIMLCMLYRDKDSSLISMDVIGDRKIRSFKLDILEKVTQS